MLRYGATGADKAQGEKLITTAAESGNARAMAELGRILLSDETRAGGPAQAEDWLRRASAAGESEGGFLLASAQRLGMLDSKEGETSQSILLAAAELGNDSARNLLISLFYRNQAAGIDRVDVLRWAEAMAMSGDTHSLLSLAGLKLEAGDLAGATSCLERAAGSGSTTAIMTLVSLAKQGPDGSQAQAAAVQHLRTQLASPATATPEASYALAQLLVMEARDQADTEEVLRHLRVAGAQRNFHAALAVDLIEKGMDPRLAMVTVMKMDDGTAYVRYVETKREERCAEGPTEAESSDAPARPIQTVMPIYPVELRAAGTIGNVTLQFLVLEDGTVGNCQVVASDHPALSAAALEAVQRWQFQPGVKDGKPVATRMQISLPFSLRE